MTSTPLTPRRPRHRWAGALLAVWLTSAAVAAPVYQVIDLGRPRGANPSHAYNLNAPGAVVGSARTSSSFAQRPVLFDGGRPLDLITESGIDAVNGFATHINGLGHIAGYLTMPDNLLWPFVYKQGTMEVVDVPGFSHPVRAMGLSDRGHLLVEGLTLDRFRRSSVRKPDGTWVMLKAWQNSDSETGEAINRRGNVVVGHAEKAGRFPSQALVWRKNKPQPVPGTEGTQSMAMAVNDRGDIAGHRYLNGCRRGFVVRDGLLTELSTDPQVCTTALGLDNLGRVVGYRDVEGLPSVGFLALDGQMLTLNDLVQSSQQGLWKITKGVMINDAGEIAAQGTPVGTNEEHALKLVPVTQH